MVSLSDTSDEAVTVAYATADGTAVANEDYMVGMGTLTFEPGETKRTILVTTIDDDTAEVTETFTVELSEPSGATLVDGTATGTITDDEDAPELSIDDVSVTEGDEARFEVRLTPSSSQTVTVGYATMGDTATEGSDYTAQSGTLTFAAGDTMMTISVPTVDDTEQESDERFAVILSNPSNATLDDDTGEGTIIDNDTDDGGDGDGNGANGDGNGGDGNGDGNGGDGNGGDGNGDGNGGDGNGDGNGGDGNGDGNGGDGNGDGHGGNGNGDGNGGNGAGNGNGVGGGRPFPTLSIGDTAVDEGHPAGFVVSLSEASDEPVTVVFATLDGTAVDGSDYTATSGVLRFDPGDTERTVTVPTIDDDTAEQTETFAVELSAPSGATVADGTGVGTIADDDDAPELSIDDAAAVSEGESAAFTVRLSAPSGVAVAVSYATMDGTAVAGSDYAATSGMLRFEPGETAQRVTVATLDDGTSESDETFTVELSAPSGATVADGTGVGTITDDDDVPELSIDDAAAVSEGESAAFTVRLSAPSGVAVSVSYATMDGTAVAGSDYAATSGMLRFEPGETAQRVTVATLDDGTSESDETFTVELSAPSGATVADGTGVGTITDDDGVPELSIDDAAAVSEGESAEFAVRLSVASAAEVTVSYHTMDGTAVAGLDYVVADGTLRFDPGETTRTVAVATLADAQVEGVEGFTVELSAPSGATVADASGTGTITDDAARRIGLVDQVVLPEVGRALAFSAVRCRIDQVLAGTTPTSGSLVPPPRLSLSPEQRPGHRWEDRAAVRQPTLEQAFDSSLFLMQSQEGEDGGGRFAAWGCVDYQHLAGGGPGSVNWDGDVSSWHVGADARVAPGLLAGVSVSRSRGAFDYRGAGRSGDAAAGAYELGLASIHPYVAWSVLPDLDVWGTGGHAWGRLQIADERTGAFLTSPATLDSGMLGASGRLLTRGATTWRLKGEWALAQMDVARAGTAFEAATMNMRRLRLGTEVSREHVYASGVSLTPWGELGLRHDDGDGETGAGLELGGGLRYLDREAGLTVEGHGRWLTVHRGTLREWGFGALVRFAPGTGGRGPTVSLMPSWGETASGVQRLWDRGAANPLLDDAPGARLEAQFGYGFTPFGSAGVLTPYGGVSLAREVARGYRLGGRLAVGRTATVSLEAERRERLAAAMVHALMLLGTVQF